MYIINKEIIQQIHTKNDKIFSSTTISEISNFIYEYR